MEMLMETLLETLGNKVRREGECLRWVARDFEFLGFYPGDLVYGLARGPVGRGAILRPCPLNEWCVDPSHREIEYGVDLKKKKVKCRHGHFLNKKGYCTECNRIKKAKWRSKKRDENKIVDRDN